MNRICFALLIAALSSGGAYADSCLFSVKIKPTEYHVNKSKGSAEYFVNVVGVMEGIVYNQGKDKEKKLEKSKDPEKVGNFALNIPNFPGLVEIVKESMRPQMLLQTLIRWEGECPHDPSDTPRDEDDVPALSIRSPKYVAGIGAISRQQRNSLKGQKPNWADRIENQ